MKNLESSPRAPLPNEVAVNSFEEARINFEESDFNEIYSDYLKDRARTQALSEIYDSQSPDSQLGKQAEALIFSLLNAHPINKHVAFRPTSLYDDYFHGTDLVVVPRNTRNARVQSVAALDITINQEDIKGSHYRDGDAAAARPIGLEKKLLRSRRYTDMLANYDPSKAREMAAWLGSGGLHQPRTNENRSMFDQAEKLFLMKYYKTPEFDIDPGKPGFVIGGPQTVISIDTMFINKALQGNQQVKNIIADLSVLEFIYCIQAEQEYLDREIQKRKDRNIFFDTHYSKVKAWTNIFDKPDLSQMVNEIVAKNQSSREFREQIIYYGQTFQKVLGR